MSEKRESLRKMIHKNVENELSPEQIEQIVEAIMKRDFVVAS